MLGYYVSHQDCVSSYVLYIQDFLHQNQPHVVWHNCLVCSEYIKLWEIDQNQIPVKQYITKQLHFHRQSLLLVHMLYCLPDCVRRANRSELRKLRRKHKNIYQPPSHMFRVSRPHIKDNEKIYELFYEIVRYLIFMYLVLLITYGQRDSNIYRVNSNLLQ